MYYIGTIECDPKYLEHYGILGMKWGVRRYQNPDGTLTEEGKTRYAMTKYADYKGLTKQGEKQYGEKFRDLANASKRSYAEYKQTDKQYQKELRKLYKDKDTFRKYSEKVVDELYDGELKKGDKGYESEVDYVMNYPITIRQAELYMKDNNPKLGEKHSKQWQQVVKDGNKLAKAILDDFSDKNIDINKVGVYWRIKDDDYLGRLSNVQSSNAIKYRKSKIE